MRSNAPAKQIFFAMIGSGGEESNGEEAGLTNVPFPSRSVSRVMVSDEIKPSETASAGRFLGLESNGINAFAGVG